MKRLLDYNAETGVREIFEGTETGFNITYEQDVENIFEHNKQGARQGKWGDNPAGSEFREVAQIPIVIQMEWLTKHGIDIYNRNHWEGVKRMLNSNEWRYLRTNEVII